LASLVSKHTKAMHEGTRAGPQCPNAHSHSLRYVEGRLELQTRNGSATHHIAVDFDHGRNARRRLSRDDLLMRAVGLKRKNPLHILDATAGLGSDAFALASLGCEVTLLERSPLVAALLEDGLNRSRLSSSSPAHRMKFIHADALRYMGGTGTVDVPDVVYLDPMYPGRAKSALGALELRILKEVVGPDEDADHLLAAALRHAGNRVVVKRRRLAAHLGGLSPDVEYSGRAVRFDVYLVHASTKIGALTPLMAAQEIFYSAAV
jgi:16S rRNA (guanine1516-N2)-methyltransferase